MIIEIIIIILAFIGAFLLCAAEIYHYYDLGFSPRCIISIIIGIALCIIPTTLFIVIPHNKNCTCNICYEPIGNKQGMELYMNKNKEIYYYDKTINQCIAIIQEDGTNYTYNEYLQDQLKEVQ